MVLHARGETSPTCGGLVGDTAFALVQGLRRLPWERIQSLTLSLRGIDQIDASGIAALVRLHSQLATSGRRLRLCHVSAPVAADLERVDLTSVLEVLDETSPEDGLCVRLMDLEARPVQPLKERIAA
jgi:anti-anti-sigma regulatory factor